MTSQFDERGRRDPSGSHVDTFAADLASVTGTRIGWSYGRLDLHSLAKLSDVCYPAAG